MSIKCEGPRHHTIQLLAGPLTLEYCNRFLVVFCFQTNSQLSLLWLGRPTTLGVLRCVAELIFVN
jgi:hypothetical protein